MLRIFIERGVLNPGSLSTRGDQSRYFCLFGFIYLARDDQSRLIVHGCPMHGAIHLQTRFGLVGPHKWSVGLGWVDGLFAIATLPNFSNDLSGAPRRLWLACGYQFAFATPLSIGIHMRTNWENAYS